MWREGPVSKFGTYAWMVVWVGVEEVRSVAPA